MLHAMHLMFLNVKAYQMITVEEEDMNILQSYSMNKKGNAMTTFFKPIGRYTSKRRNKM